MHFKVMFIGNRETQLHALHRVPSDLQGIFVFIVGIFLQCMAGARTTGKKII